jgi:hypothetical protein
LPCKADRLLQYRTGEGKGDGRLAPDGRGTDFDLAPQAIRGMKADHCQA